MVLVALICIWRNKFNFFVQDSSPCTVKRCGVWPKLSGSQRFFWPLPRSDNLEWWRRWSWRWWWSGGGGWRGRRGRGGWWWRPSIHISDDASSSFFCIIFSPMKGIFARPPNQVRSNTSCRRKLKAMRVSLRPRFMDRCWKNVPSISFWHQQVICLQ